MSAVPRRTVTAPPSPRRAARDREARSPIYRSPPPLPAPHPEPLLSVRLDLCIQLPQRVRETAEEQVLPDQLVCAFHRLRHLCARAPLGTPAAEGGGGGPEGAGRSQGEPGRLVRHAADSLPIACHAPAGATPPPAPCASAPVSFSSWFRTLSFLLVPKCHLSC